MTREQIHHDDIFDVLMRRAGPRRPEPTDCAVPTCHELRRTRDSILCQTCWDQLWPPVGKRGRVT